MSKILFVSSEAFPLAKTGGLGDVAGSLPAALLKMSQDIRLLMPAYHGVLNKVKSCKLIASTKYYNLPVQIIETRLPGSNVIVWLVDCPAAFDRPGGPYTDNHGESWHDNALRFAILCLAAVDISVNRLLIGWQPDIVHCNDWQTGLIPALLSLHRKRPATIFTIHNLAYQGIFKAQTFIDLNLPEELWHMDGLEFYGQMSFIKGGLAYADHITTVSENYAAEILEAEYSYGLDGLLKHRSEHITGILNGIDEKYWNPGTDKFLTQKYNKRSIDKKQLNKTALQQQLNLPVNVTLPMVGMISRLVSQKGFDIILQGIEDLLALPLQLVILGTGEIHFEMQLSEWAERYPKKLKVIIGYDEQLAHRIEAASDIYMMPSTFEPCGLNQLYSLYYGTLPVVTSVGGLADTVINASDKNIDNNTANGFVLTEHSAKDLIITMHKVLAMYKDRNKWRQLQLTAMSNDFSWKVSAEKYVDLYTSILMSREIF